MSDDLVLEVTVLATSDPDAAPLAIYRYPDGGQVWRRDLEDPEPGWVSRTFVPHAVVRSRPRASARTSDGERGSR